MTIAIHIHMQAVATNPVERPVCAIEAGRGEKPDTGRVGGYQG